MILRGKKRSLKINGGSENAIQSITLIVEKKKSEKNLLKDLS